MNLGKLHLGESLVRMCSATLDGQNETKYIRRCNSSKRRCGMDPHSRHSTSLLLSTPRRPGCQRSKAVDRVCVGSAWPTTSSLRRRCVIRTFHSSCHDHRSAPTDAQGNWKDDHTLSADHAYARGEVENALLHWSIAAEMGYESAQNNLAFLLERGDAAAWWLRNTDLSAHRLSDIGASAKIGSEAFEGEVMNDAALMQWVRSAAQDNVDAMVKVGDYYCQCSLHPGVRISEDLFIVASLS